MQGEPEGKSGATDGPAAPRAGRAGHRHDRAALDSIPWRERLSTQLSHYLSPQIYDALFTGRSVAEISASRKKLTVFFCDIVNFTSITESMEPEELSGMLNNYLSELTIIALAHGATVDKYIGDCIMAFFGDPETLGDKQDALACVRMSIAMQKRMGELAEVWTEKGVDQPFRLRIGVNTGYCTVGNFGSSSRMDYRPSEAR